MNSINKAAVVLLATLTALTLCQAQEVNIEELPAPPPLNLPVVVPEQAPDVANFYSAGHEWAPLPYNPYEGLTNVPIYFLQAARTKAGLPYLLFDDRMIVAAEVLAEADAEAVARTQTQTRKSVRAEPATPHTAERGLTPMTNDLQLDIEDATNGVVSLTILNPTSMTNEPVWDVWLATHFSGAPDNWTWIARTSPGQTNLLVAMPSETEAYFRLGATNNDVDGDGILDSWMSQNFGHVTAWASDHTLAANDFDFDGVNNYNEFLAGTDPNDISFTAHIGSGQTASPNPTATITVLSGVPSHMAVMVDGTNFNAPNWQAYTASPVIPLPNADGEHLVWVMLSGRVHATDWQGFGVTLDRMAPALVITGPTNDTTSKPIVQVTGYSTDAVRSLSCTLSNAAGVQTNISALVTERDFGAVTTNHFQCFDVELTSGVNALTVRVSDYAGNMRSTNLSVTFTTTNDNAAPVLTLLWPTNGARLGANIFTLRARVDDETAGVRANVVSASGVTNEYFGTVERNGAVWVEEIKLEAGTNQLTLTAMDAAMNLSVTNFTVIRSGVNVTVQEPGGLNNPFVTVSGAVSDGSYSVWVNGVHATVAGTNWSAVNVPLPAGGSATINVVAIPPGGGGSGGGNGGESDPSQLNPSDPNAVTVSIQPEKPAEVKLAHGEWSREWKENDNDPTSEAPGEYVLRYDWRYDEKAGGYAQTTFTYPWGADGRRYWLEPDGTERY